LIASFILERETSLVARPWTVEWALCTGYRAKLDLYSPMETSSKKPAAGALRAGCLNFTELSAISVANIAPTLTAVMIMSLMYGAAGNASWVAYVFGVIMLLFVALAATGSMHTYTVMGLGETAGGISAWCLVWAYLFDGIPGVAGFTIFG